MLMKMMTAATKKKMIGNTTPSWPNWVMSWFN